MGTTPIRPLVNRVLEGNLDEVLRRYSAQGLSPSRMSLRLASEYQVEVSGQTVKKWLRGLKSSAGTTSRSHESGDVVQTAQTAQTARTVCAAQPTDSEAASPRIAS